MYLRDWFDSERRWRSGAAVVWTLLLVVALSYAVAAISSIDPYDLIGSTTGSLLIITNFAFWSNVIGICMVVFIIFRLGTRNYQVCHYVPNNRLRLIGCHLSLPRIFSVTSHVVCGGAIAWSVTRIIGFQLVSSALDNPDNITDVSGQSESRTFIALHGAFVGGIYAVSFFLKGCYIIQFPIVQQTRFFQVKGRLFSLLCSSASRSLKNMMYFYVFYYFFCASFVHSWSSVFIHAQTGFGSSDDAAAAAGLDTIGGLLSIRLALGAWFSGMFVDFVLSLLNLLYIVYQTQPFEFPIEPMFEHLQDISLHHALSCDYYPLLQYLACLDLSRLAKHSKERRSLIFSVSLLGGHPLNWNNISSACLAQLQEFVDRIVEFNDCPTGQKTVGQSNDQQKQASSGSVIFRPSLAGGPTVGPCYQPTNVSAMSGACGSSVVNRMQLMRRLNDFAKRAFSRMSEFVRTHSVVTYFVAVRPDLLSLQFFNKSQKYIWLISGLSHLVAASYAEDTYGVVQQTLPDILTTFLNLLEALNRHLKQFPVRKNSQQGYASIHSLKLVLKETVKEAIYRIVITFDNHLSSVPLSVENTRRLGMFKEFKE